MSDYGCSVSCCTVRRELRGFALIAAVVAFSVAEPGFGIRSRPGRVAGSLDGGPGEIPLLGSGPQPGPDLPPCWWKASTRASLPSDGFRSICEFGNWPGGA